MGETTAISWTDKTWNPWRGCHKVSAGCKNCYMFRDAKRYGHDPNVVIRSKTTFDAPLRWKEPAKVFTCSWSDFFIEEADEWRDQAWDIIRRTPHLTYQILTKRPERIAEHLPPDWMWHYEHVWLGVTVEDQKAAATRVPILLTIPAAVRFVSCEPLLEYVDLEIGLTPDDESWDELNADEEWNEPEEFVEECEAECDWINFGHRLVVNPEYREWEADRNRAARFRTLMHGLHWVIVGGESGTGFREMKLEWARAIQRDCQNGKIAFWFKQESGLRPGMNPVLDGKVYHEFPFNGRGKR